jgi:hypothetical protein
MLIPPLLLLQLSGTLSYMVRQVSDVETNIVSVERLQEYAEVDTEVRTTNTQGVNSVKFILRFRPKPLSRISWRKINSLL